MKKILSILSITILSANILSAQPLWQWAYKAGGTTASNNIDVTYGVAKDVNNNIYSCGSYQGTATIGNNTWTAASRNAWVGKQNANGQWLWSVTGAGNIAAQAITTDSNGDVLVCGSLTGTTSLNGYALNPSGGANVSMFVAKLNGTTGVVMWGKVGRTVTTGGSVDAYSVTTDNANNVYVAGRAKGTVNFDATLGFTSSSSGVAQTLDGYILKLNSLGIVKFANRIYGATTGNADKNCYSVATDSLGHIYALGYFQCTNVRLDNTYFVSNINTTSTTNDIFIAKYDTLGVAQAMYRFGSATTTIQDFAYNIKMLNDTIAVFAGQSNNLGTLTKVNLNNGNTLNSFAATGNGTSVFYAIDKDLNNNIYATGFVSSDNATGQYFGTSNLKTNAQADLLLAKTNDILSVQSAINFGNTSATLTNEFGRCLVNLGNDDNVIGGVFASTLTLGITNLSAQGNSDLLIARYAPCNQTLAITLDPINDTICSGTSASFSFATNMVNYIIEWHKNGAVFSGYTNDTLSTTSINDNDNVFAIATSVCGVAQTQTAYVHVLQLPSITTQPVFNTTPYCLGDTAFITLSVTGENLSYAWHKGTSLLPGPNNDSLLILCTGASVTGTYYCVVSNQCGSRTSNNGLISNVFAPAIITSTPSNVIICQGTSASISPTSVSSATSYQWYLDNNPIGTSSSSYNISNMQAANTGTYSLIAFAACGNDTAEIKTVSLGTTTTLNGSTITGTSCPGSEIIYALDVTGTNLTYQWFLNSVLISGATNDSLVLSNISSAMNGPYQVIITGACGNENAGITTLSVPSFITTVTSNGITITTDDNTAQSYQWIDCTNGNPIAGENGLSFTPTVNGNYAVVMTKGICTDTSVCYSINSIGLKQYIAASEIRIFPNPTNNYITIETNGKYSLSLVNILGQELETKVIDKKIKLDISNLTEGVYYIKLSNGATMKFIKQ